MRTEESAAEHAAGRAASSSVADFVSPQEFGRYWKREYRNTRYFHVDRNWDDYAPAYRLGFHARDRYRGHRFDQIEGRIEAQWLRHAGASRLTWAEAREAARDAWYHVERALPIDFDTAAGPSPTATDRRSVRARR